VEQVTWTELDSLNGPNDIFALLKARGIKGKKGIIRECPLAKGTGWDVTYLWRTRNGISHVLTLAEVLFVFYFDVEGMYPELVEQGDRDATKSL